MCWRLISNCWIQVPWPSELWDHSSLFLQLLASNLNPAKVDAGDPTARDITSEDPTAGEPIAGMMTAAVDATKALLFTSLSLSSLLHTPLMAWQDGWCGHGIETFIPTGPASCILPASG